MTFAALFDYDGTLANTDAIHHACWNDALASHGAFIDHAFYSRNCSGVVSLEIARAILDAHVGVLLAPEALAAEKDERYEKWIASKVVALMPGVVETLRFLKQRGVRMGIVTGAPLAAITKTLVDSGVDDFFEVKVTRESVSRGKPDPAGYLLGLRQLGVDDFSQAVSLEDTRGGVLAAKAAGMCAIAIPNEYTAAHDLSAADYICSDMLEACAVLRQRFSEL